MRDGDTALLDEALEIWTRLGDEHGMGRALWGLSEYHSYRGEAELAEESARRALEIFERLADPFWIVGRGSRAPLAGLCSVTPATRQSTSSPRFGSSGRAATSPV